MSNKNLTAIEWFKQLTVHQRINLKTCGLLLCGLNWEDFIILFTPRERLNIIYDKLKQEQII